MILFQTVAFESPIFLVITSVFLGCSSVKSVKLWHKSWGNEEVYLKITVKCLLACWRWSSAEIFFLLFYSCRYALTGHRSPVTRVLFHPVYRWDLWTFTLTSWVMNLLKKDVINLSWIWDKEMMLYSPQQTEPQTFGLHDVMFTAELQIAC